MIDQNSSVSSSDTSSRTTDGSTAKESNNTVHATVTRPEPYAVIYTYQDTNYAPRDVRPSEGYTVFYDNAGNKLYSFTTGSRVDSHANRQHPGADGPYSGYFVRIEGGYRDSRISAEYGTTKIMTTDTRGRWIHGGGSKLADPYAAEQGWRVTNGCTRAQNADVEALAAHIRAFQAQHPNIRIKVIRDRNRTYAR